MTDPILLDPEQEDHAQRIALETSGAALDASTMSAGKTVVALRAAQLRGARTIVVCAPLQTRTGWKHTAEIGWRTESGESGDFRDLPFHWIRDDAKRDKVLAMLAFGEPGIYFVGRQYAVALGWDQIYDDNGEKLRNDKGKLVKRKNKLWESFTTDLLIVDEVHQGNTTATAMAHKTLSQMTTRFLLALSGTPHGNRFEGIYPVSKLLWPDRVPKTLQAFKKRFCEYEYDHFAWDHMKVIGELEPGAYFDSLPCVVRRIWEYHGFIDESDVHVELSPRQRKAYDELERSMVTMTDAGLFIIENEQALRVRLRQATLGMFTIAEDGSVDFDENCQSSKLDALRFVMEEDFEDEPAVILMDSKRFAKVTVKRLTKWGKTARLWSGDQGQDERETAKADFIAGEFKYLVMVIKAGGTGTDGLQFAARNVAIMSVDDSRIDNEQSLARSVRRGQGDLVRIRRITAIDTYDEGILQKHTQQALATKESMRRLK